ncbi:zinc finger, CCHC-type containing protein, partial [Tanacetum coccineum]
DEALDKFKVFKTEVELQQGSLIKRFWTDRGGLGQRAVVRLPDPKLKTLGERGIKCIFVGYAEHSEAFGFFVIEPNKPVSIKSKNVIFDENRLSSVPRPSLSIPKEDGDIGGSWSLKRSLKRKFDESDKEVIICLYVDDMLIFGTDQVQVDMTKEFLSSRFSMKDMVEADVIFGIRIRHESNGIAISHSYYIEKVLKKFNYFDCTPISTPIDTSEKLMPNNGQAVSQLENSRMIGCLMYAMTCTRPDIVFTVGKLSRYTSNPGTQH